jgi:hypothetical protein
LIGTRSADSGATLHLLTEEETARGIPVTYCRYPIKKREFSSFWHDLDRKMRSQSLAQLIATEGENLPLFNAIKETGEYLEIPLLILTIQDLTSGVISLKDQKVLFNGEPQLVGCCLTHEVEDFLIKQEEDELEEEEEAEEEEEDEEELAEERVQTF